MVGHPGLQLELGHPGLQLELGHPDFQTGVAGHSWSRIFSGSTLHFLVLGGPGIALE